MGGFILQNHFKTKQIFIRLFLPFLFFFFFFTKLQHFRARFYTIRNAKRYRLAKSHPVIAWKIQSTVSESGRLVYGILGKVSTAWNLAEDPSRVVGSTNRSAVSNPRWKKMENHGRSEDDERREAVLSSRHVVDKKLAEYEVRARKSSRNRATISGSWKSSRYVKEGIDVQWTTLCFSRWDFSNVALTSDARARVYFRRTVKEKHETPSWKSLARNKNRGSLRATSRNLNVTCCRQTFSTGNYPCKFVKHFCEGNLEDGA